MSLHYRIAVIAALALATTAAADPLTSTITYQGSLGRDGIPYDGAANIRFRLFDAAAGGIQQCVDTQLLTVVNGVFTADINCPFNAYADMRRWVQIEVEAPPGDGFVTLAPRQEIAGTPYAFFALDAADADSLGGLSPGAYLRSNASDTFAGATLTMGGALRFNNDLNSIQFPATTAPNNPMIFMFASGTVNADRMVIAHSPSFSDWGLAYVDDGDRLQIQQNFAGTAALTVDLNLNRVGINNEDPAVPLHVVGSMRASSLSDHDDTNYFLDLSSTGTALDIAGSIAMEANKGINANGQLTIGGANLILRLGDSTADEVVIPGRDLYMGDTVNVVDGDQSIYFTDAAFATANYIRWDDIAAVSCGGSIGTIDSLFQWQINDNVQSAWAFTNGADVEFIVDDIGAMQIDATLTQNGACDIAEAFPGPRDLPAGTVMVVDPANPEGVIPSTIAYEGGIVGAISTRPGILLGGPTADAYPVFEELQQARQQLALPDHTRVRLQELEHQRRAAADKPGGIAATDELALTDEIARLTLRDPALVQRRNDLEAALDTWTRGNTNVALVGRVPVRVLGPVAAGDYLTTSRIPGVAMAMTAAGPTLGIAMESFDGRGESTVVALIQPGYWAPEDTAAGPLNAADATTVARQQAQIDALADENANLQDRLTRLEAALDELLAP